MDIDKLIKKKTKGYYFRIDIGKDPTTGKRRQQSFGPFKTKTEAKKELIKIRTQVMQGTYFKPSVKEFESFINEWFDTVYCQNKSETTIETRRYIIDSQLIPYFGKMPLKDINTRLIDKFFAELQENGRKPRKTDECEEKEDKKKDLSQSYLHIIFGLLNQAFNKAVAWELIRVNPMENAQKIVVKNNKSKRNRAWTKEEVNIFLEAASKKGLVTPFLVDVVTGVRRGELLGLKWEDIDFKNKTITINGTLYRRKGEGLKYKQKTKTESSDNRVIPIPDTVVELLKKEKALQDEMKKKFGNSYNSENFIFINDKGEPIDPDYLTRKFREIVKTLNVKQINLHGLRHTAATLLMKLGVHAKIVSDMLGHSRIQVTLDFYSHSDEEMIRQSTNELEQHIFS
ncbi:tyrosine-type recombinase/integrase [Thermaerobacillus caldiproteolyticus]|uniref:Integrase n=1 Tax=Thermaerobacillus caldiproteolyticus TaxID=247480 RepID=A0A7V9Z9J5_9BACL|nr:tyrosine-type recombinase/integrase [Anoxybacillus caldiproteolyticus]MBA2876376.1 integrase [Anoxybacillus caldiproteolyticus]